MGLTARRAQSWRARSRAGIALVVLTAWFGTLLVASPTLSPAVAAPADPIAIVGPTTSPDNDPSPSWTFSLPADDVGTPLPVPADPAVQKDPSDTATAVIAVTHRGKCFVGRSGPGSYVDCVTSIGPNQYRYTPPVLTADGDYTFYVHDVETTTTTTTTYHQDGTTTEVETSRLENPGNDSLSSIYSFDGSAPTLAFLTQPTTPSSRTQATWTFDKGDADTVSCSMSPSVPDVDPAAPCISPLVVNIPALGSYTLTVTATDALGNSSTRSSTYVRTATAAPGVSVTSPGSSTNVTWNLAPSPDADSLTAVLTSPSGSSTSTTLAAGTTSFPTVLSPAADGAWTLAVTEAVGSQTSPAGSATYVLDRDVPVLAVGTTDATDPTRPSWTVAVTDNAPAAIAKCRLTGTGGVDTGLVNCGATYTAPPLAEGTYTLNVTATDGAGNSATPETRTYTYDVTDPGAPVLGGATGDTRTDPIVWTVAKAVGDTDTDRIVCVVTGPSGPPVTTNPCGATVSVSAPAQGVWTLTATAYDASNNDSPTATRSVTFDNTPPTITVTPKTSPSTSPTWNVAVGSSGETATCSMAGVFAATDCTNKDITADLTTQPGGDYTLVVNAVDDAGNIATDSAGHVRAPDTPTVSVAAQGRSLNPTWTISAQSGATLACTLVAPGAGGARTAVPSCTTGTISPSLPGGTNGTWNLEVVATITTSAGPTPSAVGSASPGYLLDTLPPGDPTITGTPTRSQNSGGASWTIAPAAGTTRVDCGVFHNGALDRTVPSCETGGVSLTFAGAADEGPWQIKATAYDQVGNPSNVISGPIVTYDVSLPAAPNITPLASPSNDTSPTWTITHEVGSSLECSWTTGGAAPATWFTCANPATLNIPGTQNDGVYTLNARATDAAGNLGPEATPVDYELDRTDPALAVISSPTSPNSNATVTWNINTAPEITPTVKCQLLQDNGGTFGVVTGYAWANCTTPTSMTVTLPTENTYRLQVEVTDRAGNVGPVRTSADYTYDETPPDAPLVDGPTGPSKVRDVTWDITPTDMADTLECRFVENGTPIGVFTTCQTKTQVSRTGLPDGSYALQVQERDAALNVSTPIAVSPTYVIDNAGPVAPTFGGSNGTGKVRSTSWSFSVLNEPNSTAYCLLLLDGAAQTGDQPAVCQTGDTFGLNRGDGAYQVEVYFTDEAGNAGTPTKSPTYVLDTVLPAAPTNILGSVTGTAKTTSASYTFDTEPGTVSCRLLFAPVGTLTPPAAIAPGTYTTCTSPWPVNFAAGDGSYQLQLHVTDAAGNVGPDAESAVYTLDTTGPLAPTFLTQPTLTDNVKDVTWTWSGETPSTGTCTLTLTPVGSTTATIVEGPTACNTGSYASTLTYGDGFYQLSVQLTDPQTNPGAVAVSTGYTLDATAPGVPTVTGPSGTSNKTAADYAISSQVEALATTECKLTRDTTVVSDWAPCTMPRTITLAGDGSYVLEVRVIDQYGNVGLPGASPAFLLDTKLPSVPQVTAPASPSSNASPAFGIVTDADTKITCQVTRGSVVAVDTIACAAPTFTPSLSGQPDGDYVLTVIATDPAGNTATGTSGTYNYDTTAPTTPVVTGPAGPSQLRTPTFAWTGEPGASPSCSLQEKVGTPTAYVPCASPYSPSLPTDGSWVLSVRLTDAAGNVSEAGPSGAYVFDTTPPVTPIVAAPTSPGRDLAPSWSASTEEGSATECRLVGPGQLGAWAACTLPLTTSIVGDGEYTLEVRATDAAGNISPIGKGTYLLDTTAPGAPVVVQPTGPGRSRNPQISFTHDAETTGSCKLTRGATVLSDSAPCSSPASLDLNGLPDGAYTLSVRAVDRAGNVGPAGTATYVLDTTAPTIPTFTLVAGSPSSDVAPVFGFNAELGTTLTCKLTTPGGAVRDLGCISPLTVDLFGSPDGAYTLNVRATDPAGNTSAPATTTYNLDSTAPMAPKIVGPVTPGANRAPVWRVSSSSPAECRLTRGTTIIRDWTACGTSYSADLFAQPDGAYILEARVIGTTAPTSSRYRLDTTGPGGATIVGPPSPSTSRKPTWAVSSADTTVRAECRVLVFTGVLKDWAPCAVSPAGSLYALDLTGVGDGTYSLVVRLTDAAGNLGPTASSDYVLDTSAPAAVGVIAPLSPGNDTTPTWTLTSATGVKLECRLTSGQKVISDFAPCTGAFTADLSGLPDGTYTLTVHALSAAGTPGPETTSGYILDTTAAGAPGTLTGPTGPSRDRAPKWTFTLAPGTTATCKVTIGGKVFRDGPCSSPYVLDLSNAADGTYTLTVRAVDAAGNLGSPSTAGYILKTSPPPAPVLTMQPGSPSSTTDPRWGFSLFRGTTGQCRLLQGGNALEDWTPCTTPVTALLSNKPDGRYTMQVRAIDLALNTSPSVGGDYTLDRSAAPLAEFVSTPNTPGNDTTPTWVVAAPPATSPAPTAPALLRTAALTGTPQTECRLTSRGAVGGWAPCSGSYNATTNGDGTYLLEVRAFDSAGERGPASSSAYLLDTRVPAAPRFTDPVPPPVGNDAEVAWSWVDDENLVQCRMLRNGAPLGGFTQCEPPHVFSVGRLGEATYVIEARAVDAAGNVGPVTSGGYRYDVTPPAAPVFVNRPPARGTSSSVGWTFPMPVDIDRAVCVVTRNGTVISEGSCAGAFTLDLRGQQPATWTVSVHYVDAAGNDGPSTAGSYTLLSAVGRGRVDAPVFPGGNGGLPPGSGPGNGGLPVPGGTNSPDVAPTGSNGVTDEPRAGAAVPRIPDVIKKTVKKVATSIPAIPGALPGTDVPKAIKNALGQTITKPQLPLALFIIVLLFLLVQNRIDRRDPKLAAAPTSAEPELTFGPIFRPGGASA